MFAFWIAAAALSAVVGWLMLNGARAATRFAGDDPTLAVHPQTLAQHPLTPVVQTRFKLEQPSAINTEPCRYQSPNQTAQLPRSTW